MVISISCPWDDSCTSTELLPPRSQYVSSQGKRTEDRNVQGNEDLSLPCPKKYTETVNQHVWKSASSYRNPPSIKYTGYILNHYPTSIAHLLWWWREYIKGAGYSRVLLLLLLSHSGQLCYSMGLGPSQPAALGTSMKRLTSPILVEAKGLCLYSLILKVILSAGWELQGISIQLLRLLRSISCHATLVSRNGSCPTLSVFLFTRTKHTQTFKFWNGHVYSHCAGSTCLWMVLALILWCEILGGYDYWNCLLLPNHNTFHFKNRVAGKEESIIKIDGRHS